MHNHLITKAFDYILSSSISSQKNSMLENTGFSEITQERLNFKNGFWYCELAVTGNCNFSCTYCNKLKSFIDYNEIISFIDKYSNLRHVQITGGEPYLYPKLRNLCEFIKSKNIKIGLSTNGSANLYFYQSLPIDMFSISLDDYDEKILLCHGYHNVQTIINNISQLSKSHYVNIGLVIDHLNVDRISEIIDFILFLGVHDIKLSVSTKDQVTPIFDDKDYSKYPILNYRIERFRQGINMRGILESDNFKCHLSQNDISIVGRNHYPCLVYAREGGSPIGLLKNDVMSDRQNWFKNHIPKLDPICKKFCMDFKCAYNRSANLLAFSKN